MILVQSYLLYFGKMKHAVSHADLRSDCVIAPAWVPILATSLSSTVSHTSFLSTESQHWVRHRYENVTVLLSFFYILKEVFIMCIHEGVVCMSIEASRVQKSIIRTPKLELQMAVSHVMLDCARRNWTQVLCKHSTHSLLSRLSNRIPIKLASHMC